MKLVEEAERRDCLFFGNIETQEEVLPAEAATDMRGREVQP